MRIQLDEYHFLNTDSFCCWITREKPNKDGKISPRNMSGYYPTFTGAVESYIERRIKSSEATEIAELKSEVEALKAEIRGWEGRYEKQG